MAEFTVSFHQKIRYREVISSLNGFDNDFFNALIQGNIEDVQKMKKSDSASTV